MKNPIINDIPCVLLAGGKSSRFITNNIQINKALMPFESYFSLLEHQYTRLLKLFKKVIISAKKSYELNAPYLLERESDLFSPLFGIYNAFLTLQTPYIFFIPIDTPLVSFESIKALCGIKNFSVVYAKSPTKEHYLISLWHQNNLNALSHALKTQNYRLSDLVKNTSSIAMHFNKEEEFLNLNTLKDYELAVQILKERTNG
ncbi:molybdenum cofactor guanylyltransferase MobA [Helicobacter pylori]|uniref:molybdenum cofactor guanylyltransferase MobA n=1 Tax=Helicobacter pylori TaxID=210 RepID=UPI00026A73C9|nr:molybdenum cofactor guanylyltransferase MobA [Helicobacter pylori]EJB22050.1 putative molybdopterin-guanine dinucleotide biosynthesis protein A [Helicobacter pylori CPY6261]PUD15765.1 molybdenum cofactor guanylyltransferase MobA [Helicobacter pylori]BAW65624.1 molybdopterin-guanine dinucleotide biosynthesis protein MobA [Helicobacter pylori]BBK69580.1 molybdopterin-guanine dinucleotide biosynthesisprotein MobA [Helicobacter pylori]GHQ30678.1 molybdenum cofactor guanylyltransferase [Helicoba